MWENSKTLNTRVAPNARKIPCKMSLKNEVIIQNFACGRFHNNNKIRRNVEQVNEFENERSTTRMGWGGVY